MTKYNVEFFEGTSKIMGYDSIQHANKGVFRELEEEFGSYDYEGKFEEGE